MDALAESFGHRAQIFAYDQTAIARAFECEQAQKIVERETHIGADFRLGSKRHEELALQTDDMIDPQAAGMSHVRAQKLRERREIAS
jgi:hypothetical protein